MTWYDGGDTKENIPVELPFRFLVLDQLNAVTGFNKKTETGYWSNEVRGVEDEITVRDKHGIVKTGTWREIKGAIGDKGALFTKSVYIAFYDGEELQIGNIKFSGSALSGLSDATIKTNLAEHKKNPKVELFPDELFPRVGWFNFSAANRDIEDIAVELTDSVWDKNGTVEFYRPVFRRVEKISPETNEAALELDKILQVYLREYLKQNKSLQAEAPDDSAQETGEDFIEEQNADIDAEERPEEEWEEMKPPTKTSEVKSETKATPKATVKAEPKEREPISPKQRDRIIELCELKGKDKNAVASDFSDGRTELIEDLFEDEAANVIMAVSRMKAE